MLRPLRIKSNFINPFWLRAFGTGKDGVVGDNSEIAIGDEILMFSNDSEKLPKGTKVKVYLNGNFYCETLQELEEKELIKLKEREQLKKKQELEEIEAIKIYNRRKQEALEFNSKIKIPAKWTVAYKDNLSGLSESSWGDGRKRNTVEHVLLLSPLSVGRLKRNEGDFLCTTKSGNNGKNYSGQNTDTSYGWDGDGKPYVSKVTCKACLDIIQKLNKNKGK